MLRKLRSRISYANVVATLALFVAVGTGGAYAANTVFSTDIVDGEVKSVDVGDAEIKSADVKDQSLTTFDVSTFLGADVVDNTLTGDDVDESTLSLGVPWTEVPNGSTAECDADINLKTVYWTTPGINGDATLAYQRDRAGYVHLKGTATCPPHTGSTWPSTINYVFILPPGYRPAQWDVSPHWRMTSLTTIGIGSAGASTCSQRRYADLDLSQRRHVPMRAVGPERLPLDRQQLNPVGRAPRPL